MCSGHRPLLATGAVVVVAGAALGIGVSTTSGARTQPRLTVSGWLHDGGSQLMKTLGDDFTALKGPDQSLDLSKMDAGCLTPRADVRAAQAYAAVPDATIEIDWTQALAQFAAGGDRLREGLGNAGLLAGSSRPPTRFRKARRAWST